MTLASFRGGHLRVLGCRFVCLALALTLPAGAATAHPHGWIDLQSRIILDDRGRIEAVELSWLFDEWYTTVVAEDFPGAEKKATSFLEEVGERNLANLKDYNYFTELTVDGKPVAIAEVAEHETGLKEARLEMRFTVPLAEPIERGSGEIALRVFDPTYYIEIVYAEEGPFGFVGEGADSCDGVVIEPNPSLEVVTFASSLDQTQSGGDDLGKLFAQTLEIRCP
jgi:ABC-type uncharacterized transport system substrate-binding protein